MQTIIARNVNEAWDQAKVFLNESHIVRNSRVGEVWEYPTPVTTRHIYPRERVLFNVERNANPYFHFMEALWMLAGRCDVAWIAQFNPRMKEYSDDGVSFHGAYGYRWRFAFDLDGGAEDDYADQLVKIVRMLKKDFNERRAVLSMWNPIWDLERPDCRDLPCNTTVFFKIREGRLTMTVCCRSNDIVWGTYGANAVHMSMLQEYLASMIGVPVGEYWQISDSWHAYTARWAEFGGFSNRLTLDPYLSAEVSPYPMVIDPPSWDQDLKNFMRSSETGESFIYVNPFFEYVAEPLLRSWRAYKSEGGMRDALLWACRCQASDWGLAATQWLERIQEKRNKKQSVETRNN